MNPEQKILAAVDEHIRKNGSITNRECRELLGLSYDHAIRLLGTLSRAGILHRKGASSSTKYVHTMRGAVSKEILEAALVEVGKLLKPVGRRNSE